MGTGVRVADVKPKKKTSSARRSAAPSKGSSVGLRLEALARNLWWTWSADAQLFWESLAARLDSNNSGKRVHPFALVRSLSSRALARLDSDPDFLESLARVETLFAEATKPLPSPAGLDHREPVAYLSMEYGLHESLPIYAGGLGLLAGDHLKSASDLGVPLVAIGVFYRQGYFRQELDADGRQEVIYPSVDYSTLPLEAVHRPGDDRELRIAVELAGRRISLRVWKIAVGRVSAYLLDSDVPENRPDDRKITYRLYGGTREDRIRQEIIAGIGGLRLLRELGIRPGVWHLNEGHVAFVSLERIRELRESAGLSFAEAVQAVAADTVFTTHTPVPEGNEVFDFALADRYLRPYAEAAGIELEDYFALGLDSDASGRRFLSLTVLALRLSRMRNGVSRLHGEVSRRMWSKLWPGMQSEEVPITSVTNGIHTPSWVAPAFDALYREHLGERWCDQLANTAFWERVTAIPDRKIWIIKAGLKRRLVDFVRRRAAERLERSGASAAEILKSTENLLDPEAFTIGFARRFALYKRSALLFRDIERAARLFGSKDRPVQIIFAGKPHPEDPAGRAVFEEVHAISQRPEFKGRVVLLENYDIEVARHLVQGVDLWLNNPRRPLEASGTSGQKVPINAGVNLSNLDGWWCEGAAPDAGFSFGKTKEYSDPAQQDREDAESLLGVLERKVVPLYYRRDRRGLPKRWLDLVRSSMARLVPAFSTHTMVLRYAQDLYAPAYENGQLIRASGHALARELAAWTAKVERSWPFVHVRAVRDVGTPKKVEGGRGGASTSAKKTTRSGSSRRGAKSRQSSRRVEVEVYLAGIDPRDFCCTDAEGSIIPIRAATAAKDGTTRFRLEVERPGSYRLIPVHADLVHPQELGRSILFEI
jgi:starch phosphorylase